MSKPKSGRRRAHEEFYAFVAPGAARGRGCHAYRAWARLCFCRACGRDNPVAKIPGLGVTTRLPPDPFGSLSDQARREAHDQRADNAKVHGEDQSVRTDVMKASAFRPRLKIGGAAAGGILEPEEAEQELHPGCGAPDGAWRGRAQKNTVPPWKPRTPPSAPIRG